MVEHGGKWDDGRPQKKHDLKKDPFGHVAFAKHIADGILNQSPEDGLVLGIYGPWGSGKSTTLDAIEQFLNKSKNSANVLKVHFRPWIFEGSDSLTLRFFQAFGSTIGANKGKVFAEVTEKLGRLAEILSPYTNFTVPSINKITELFKKNGDERKEQLVDALCDLGVPIVVFIDDIDRLTNQEIRDLFRLIKSVADFPNTTYVLAFDHAMVAKALDESGTDGAAFIEKIVQVPFELPMPGGEPLIQMLTGEIDQLIKGIPEGRWDQEHWHRIFQFGGRIFFNTPRDVIRFINTLKLTFPAVQDNVDPVDFIGIEMLRVFRPEVYDSVRRNQDKLTRVATPGSKPSTEPFYANLRDRLVGDEKNTLRKCWVSCSPFFLFNGMTLQLEGGMTTPPRLATPSATKTILKPTSVTHFRPTPFPTRMFSAF